MLILCSTGQNFVWCDRGIIATKVVPSVAFIGEKMQLRATFYLLLIQLCPLLPLCFRLYNNAQCTCFKQAKPHKIYDFVLLIFVRAVAMVSVYAQYRPYLVSLMRYVHDTDFDDDEQFTQAQLAAITAHDFMRYVKFRVYGDEDAPDDADPIGARAHTIQFWKKAISYFMPNRNHPWNEISLTGNPTRCREIGALITRVKRKQTRGLGRPSQVRREIKEPEFRHMLNVLRLDNHFITRYGYPALLVMQFTMIGRVDDACKWIVQNLKRHEQFPDIALHCRWNWSKNVIDETDAPWQILLGSMDPDFCVIANVGMFLELHLSATPGAALSPYVLSFSNDNRVPHGGNKAKARAQRVFRQLFRNDDFYDHAAGPLGTHSYRKFPSNWVCRQGVPPHLKDVRGRWKDRTRVSHVYESPELPYIDAMVASKLCVGGPCGYVKRDENLQDHWILQHVTPSIQECYGNDVALVFGKALLWLTFSEKADRLPEHFCNRVRDSYNLLPGALEEGENPIMKKLIIVTGDAMMVNLTMVEEGEEEGNDGGNDMVGQAHQTTQQLLTGLYADNAAIRRQMTEMQLEAREEAARNQQRYRNVAASVGRLERRPFHAAPNVHGGQNQVGNNNPGAPNAFVPNAIQAEASLSPTPRTLYTLWEEYMVGIGGRKPAREFTMHERGGANKFKYCRRKVVWDLIESMMRSGLSSNVCIDRIYTAYGENRSVTEIINLVRRDKNEGNLPHGLAIGIP